jgi:large subunit ribosomal protein L6
MSRVGKYPVSLPLGVQVTREGVVLSVKGKLGVLFLTLTDHVLVTLEAERVVVTPRQKSKPARMMWGTVRSLIASMVEGVTKGYRKNLEINGTGYRASVQGKILLLNLGYSHDVSYPIPVGITITTPKPTMIIVEGVDKRQVGQVAAEIMAARRRDSYKGKGIRQENTKPRLKAGKKK